MSLYFSVFCSFCKRIVITFSIISWCEVFHLVSALKCALLNFISLDVVQLEQVLRKSQNRNVLGQTLAVANFPRTVPPSSWTRIFRMLLPNTMLLQMRNKVARRVIVVSTRSSLQIHVRELICEL